MKEILEHLEFKQAQFGLHPFLRRLDRNEPLRQVLPFASYLTFWVMVFQDILRLNDRRVGDPALKKMSRHHRAGDAGHDRWFLADLVKIEGSYPDVREVFSASHASTRDTAYSLMSEVYVAQSDAERVVLLLSVEYTAHVFFEKIASYFERQGVMVALQYFARHHIEVEKQHSLFEEQMTRQLREMVLEPQVKERCLQLVDRAFLAFNQMLDGLERRVSEDLSRSEWPSNLKKRMAREERLLQTEARLRQHQPPPASV
jgi:hypothetical protein